MLDTEVPHEAETIAVRRIIAEKFPRATGIEVHEHEGRFIGLTFHLADRAPKHFYWADPTGATPERPRPAREQAATVLLRRAERVTAHRSPTDSGD